MTKPVLRWKIRSKRARNWMRRRGVRGEPKIPHAAEQRRFDGGAVLHQQIGDAVEAAQRHRLEVDVEQFAKCTLCAQPTPGGQLAAGVGHAGDQAADDRGPLRAVEAEIAQNLVEPKPAEGSQSHRLHADRTGGRSCSESTSTSTKIGAGATADSEGAGWDVAAPLAIRRAA